MSLTYGSLFAGYAGLEIGVQSVLGGEMAWCAEFDSAPSRILAHHYPHVPNLGDVTKVDWRTVEPVDVITGGSPCQDLSHAGKRQGMKAGTRSGLWASMCDAIDIIRPRLVVWENVRGVLSAEADSAMEQCPGCLGDGDDGPVLRALGRVLGDLADVGYDARWYGLRAADVGAAHGRFRVFLFATPTDASGQGLQERGDTRGIREMTPQSPAAADGDRDARPGTLTLLPTPAVNDMGAGKTPDAWDAWTDRMQAAHGNGNGHDKSLEIEAMRLLKTKGGPNQRGSSGDLMLPSVAARLLPTPTTSDAKASGSFGYGEQEFSTLTDATVRQSQDWRGYEAAIRRHEDAIGRPAPSPTETGATGQPRLSPRFVEWLMMLPDGWVTDVPGVSRNDQLKALGNGVVPAQAAAATQAFVRDTREAVAS